MAKDKYSTRRPTPADEPVDPAVDVEETAPLVTDLPVGAEGDGTPVPATNAEEDEPRLIRTVRMRQYYRGRRTQEQVINPGEYAEDDPALFGLAKFLVGAGYAEWVE